MLEAKNVTSAFLVIISDIYLLLVLFYSALFVLKTTFLLIFRKNQGSASLTTCDGFVVSATFILSTKLKIKYRGSCIGEIRCLSCHLYLLYLLSSRACFAMFDDIPTTAKASSKALQAQSYRLLFHYQSRDQRGRLGVASFSTEGIVVAGVVGAGR